MCMSSASEGFTRLLAPKTSSTYSLKWTWRIVACKLASYRQMIGGISSRISTCCPGAIKRGRTWLYFGISLSTCEYLAGVKVYAAFVTYRYPQSLKGPPLLRPFRELNALRVSDLFRALNYNISLSFIWKGVKFRARESIYVPLYYASADTDAARSFSLCSRVTGKYSSI